MISPAPPTGPVPPDGPASADPAPPGGPFLPPVRVAADGPDTLDGPACIPAWIVWSLRATATLYLVTVLGQAVIGGLFVTGEVDLLRWHSLNSAVGTALVGLQLIAAITLWRPGRGPAWPIWASAAQLVLMSAQALLGIQRVIALHIPLATVIFGVAVSMTAWTWRAGRERA